MIIFFGECVLNRSFLTWWHSNLASSLLFISELIEEHSRIAKVVGQRGVYVSVIFLMLFDDLIAPSVYNRAARRALFYRLIAVAPNTILSHLPCRLSSNLLELVAPDFAVVNLVFGVLRARGHQPFLMVLLLFSRHP